MAKAMKGGSDDAGGLHIQCQKSMEEFTEVALLAFRSRLFSSNGTSEAVERGSMHRAKAIFLSRLVVLSAEVHGNGQIQ